MLTTFTVRGITYDKGDSFKCYESHSGWSNSAGSTADGSTSAQALTKNETYYIYGKSEIDDNPYPYAISISQDALPRGWYTEEVFPYKTYTVKYNANGGSGAPSSQTKKHGVTLVLSSTVPTRSGYTFVGWGSEESDITANYRAGDNYTENSGTTLYAIWKKTVALHFNVNGGNESIASLNKVIYNDESATFRVTNTVPTRAYHTFLGWSKDKNADSASYKSGDSISITEETSLYAVWEENTLTINYWSNFATAYSGTDEYPALNTVNNNNVIVFTKGYKYSGNHNNGLLNYKEEGSSLYMYRTGYTATGNWGTSTSGGTLVGQDETDLNTGQKIAIALGKDLTSGHASINVYAQWKENSLTIDYYSNYADYGTYQGDPLLDVNVNSNVCVHSNAYYYSKSYEDGLNDIQNPDYLYLSKTGYFSTGHWGTTSSGGTLINEKTSFVTGQELAKEFGLSLENGNESIIVYAQWTPANAVYYNHNGTDIFCYTYGKVGNVWEPMLLYGNVNGEWQKLTNIGHDGKVLFKNGAFINYVSLGDSIAVGHSINSDWETDYGWHTQYGENDNTSTTIVPNSYTDHVRKKLISIYGDENVIATSYAHTGDTNVDLRDKLEHKAVQDSIRQAKLVTISIGANTILGPATKEIPNFIANGNPTLVQLDNDLESGFNLLSSDAETYGSYRNIMTKLKELNTNPNTKFVFTTVYNPYKFLWVDESTDENDYIDGYFGPIMWVVPNVEIDIPFVGQMDVRKFVYESAFLLDVSKRINNPSGDGSYSLGQWVEGKIAILNEIIKDAVVSFGDSRFAVADTKRLFDSYPDRHIREDYNYSDMVNVEIVRSQTIQDLDWGRFWDNWSVDSLSNIVEDIAMTVVEEAILPDTDPHPEEDGQYALYRSFADVLGLEPIKRYTITYNANGGSGSAFTQAVFTIGYDRQGRNLIAYPTLEANMFAPSTGYYFTGWNTKADGSGTSYSAGQLVGLNSNLDLYAQWSNMYTLSADSVPNSKSVTQSGSNTGIQDDYYQLWIEGTRQPNFGAFSNVPRVASYPYGTSIGVIIKTVCGSSDLPSIRVNGSTISNTWDEYNQGHVYQFTLTKDTHIEFEWCDWGCISNPLYPVGDKYIGADAYWDCYITTY